MFVVNLSAMAANINKPIIVQSDRSILLETDSPVFENARDDLAAFAELVKSPEHIHTYRLTPLSLWNAAASGIAGRHVAQLHGGQLRRPRSRRGGPRSERAHVTRGVELGDGVHRHRRVHPLELAGAEGACLEAGRQAPTAARTARRRDFQRHGFLRVCRCNRRWCLSASF